MRGSIHECVVKIKSGNQSQILLRHPSGCYQLARVADEYGLAFFNPSHKRYDDVIGVFNRKIPVADIYDEAGEPVPGE